MKILSFENAADLDSFRSAHPGIDLGIVRGELGLPGRYELSGEVGDDNEPVWAEVKPPVSYGYCTAIAAAVLSPELEPYEISPGYGFTGYSAAPWSRPTGAHDAYPAGYCTSHAGKLWVSLTAANVWEPGVSGWREVVPAVDGEDPPPPAWIQPTGAHDAYPRGFRATHAGSVWINDRAGNVWEPGSINSGWSQEDADDDQWPEWVRPTGAHDAYPAGAQVTFEGNRYTSLIDGNVWSPSEYPAGWEGQA